ncbi:MAG: hypothetical protein O3A55_05960 [Bacteroidetes bacterium]|nr:hypothetical protein [Bacteroidota bacterium]
MKQSVIKLLVISNIILSDLKAFNFGVDSLSQKHNISGGIGVLSVNIKDVINFVNSKNADEHITEFSSLPEFFLYYSYNINNNYSAGLELNYNVKYLPLTNSNDGIGEIDYNLISYIINLSKNNIEKNLTYSYGIFTGFVKGELSEKNNIYGIEKLYSTTGYVFGAKSLIKLSFDEKLSSYIDLVIKNNSTQKLKTAKNELKFNSNNVTLSYFGVGIRFGLSYNL